MPDWFVLEFQLPDGTWIWMRRYAHSSTSAAMTTPSYLRSDGGSGLWIRAVRIDEDGVIDHVDGGKEHYRYRLVALPNERYSLTERDRPIAPDATDR